MTTGTERSSEPARGDCPVCRVSYRLTKAGLMIRHNGAMRSRLVCEGSGKTPRPLARIRKTEGLEVHYENHYPAFESEDLDTETLKGVLR